MSHEVDADIPPLVPGRWLAIVRGLCLLALGLSGYLLWVSSTGEHLPGCGLESGCGAVLSSRWAYLFGLPVTFAALLLYAVVLAATVVLQRTRKLATRNKVRGLMVSAAVALLSAAVWFICLQVFVVGAICPFCMTAHGCGILVGSLILMNTLGETGGNDGTMARPAKALWVLAGFMAVAAMATGQVVSRPKTFVVLPSGNSAVRQTPRTLHLHGDAFQVDLRNVPLLGSPAAPYVIVHLFDYSCPHCRALHPLLVQAFRDFSNQIAVVSLPMPLATNCNPLLKRPIPAHINACSYAKSGLAVWRANSAKLPEFDDWIFAPTRPPSPEAVQVEAMRLVGTNEFNQAMGDPWIQQQLDLSIGLYATNHARYRKDALPELMIGTNIIAGVVENVNDLYKVLTNQFNLGGPSSGSEISHTTGNGSH